MSRALRGSTAELPPPTRYRSLERGGHKTAGAVRRGSGGAFASGGGHHDRLSSPRHHPARAAAAGPFHSATAPSSQHSTPKRASCVVSPQPHLAAFGGGGSLTRSSSSGGGVGGKPLGKMPLHGKVAGYRQPSLLPHHFPTTATSPGPPHRDGGESWGGGDGSCDNEAMVQMSLQQQNAVYGYMDDHKKMMIQQWVEGQAMAANNHQTEPPQHLTGRNRVQRRCLKVVVQVRHI